MESQKMISLMDKLLEMQKGKKGLPPYTGDSKRLIDEIADLAEDTFAWEWSHLDGREFTRGMTTLEMWNHAKRKYAGATSQLFKAAAVVGMMPLIRCRLAFMAEIGEALHFE